MMKIKLLAFFLFLATYSFSQGMADYGYIAPNPYHPDKYIRFEDAHRAKCTLVKKFSADSCSMMLATYAAYDGAKQKQQMLTDTFFIHHLPDSLSVPGRIFCIMFFFTPEEDKPKTPAKQPNHRHVDFLWFDDERYGGCLKH